MLSPRVSSTASQARETDQTTRIDSTEHPESCQLASPQVTSSEEKLTRTQRWNSLWGNSQASQKTKPAQNRFPEATTISHIIRHNVTFNCNRNAISHFRSITIKTQSECPPEDFDTVSSFRQCNRKLKTASESTKPFKPSLKTAIEMNEVNYRPIASCVNTLSSSTWPHEEQWKMERPKLSISKHPSKELKEKANILSKYWDKHVLSTPEDQAGHTTPTALQITLH